ncbi:MAG: response regulator [Deltaproteobacteria bacterium]|nr:response regulator [Deltaproteobacteria bacterium]
MRKKTGSALVVGAGISGIRAALDLAEFGYQVILIDRTPHLGGVLTQLDYQFPTDHCGMCKMLPLVERDHSSQYCLRKGLFHENIDILLSTELVNLEGEPGKFQATLLQKASMVDPERCNGCGECSLVCPVEVPDEFNAGLSLRKAVYLPVPHNIPNHYVVDMASCTMCGECEKVCATGAIDFGWEARRQFRILVVDDELIIRDSLKEWLEEEGFRVDMAASGAEALEQLGRESYQLMLLDIKMPGMDGVEVLQRSKEVRPELPVVMMTAYATVETAVEAMKIGAYDYLMKPFDPETLVPLVVRLYEGLERRGEKQLQVGAVILAAGFCSYNPAADRNIYGYGLLPNVVTSMEYERMVSRTGPSSGRLLRPSDGKQIRRIAWLQCVGSRDRQGDADYCSAVCCMISIKEALLAKERSQGEVHTAIFYMDMRTFGKNHQRYRHRAEHDFGVQFIRSRVHSVSPASQEGDILVSYTDAAGVNREEPFDLLVLATGQRPPAGAAALAEMTSVDLNSWGFCQVEEFFPSRSSREGVLVAGSFSGLRDISESVVQASSAACAASQLLHSKGGTLAAEVRLQDDYRDVSREPPLLYVAICTCGGKLQEDTALQEIEKMLASRPGVVGVERIQRVCTKEGWAQLEDALRQSEANRVVIGACMPYVYTERLRQLGQRLGLQPALMDVVDIHSAALASGDEQGSQQGTAAIWSALAMAMGKLQGMDPLPATQKKIIQKALVVGGGIAGMTAALAIADHGFEVVLVEQQAELGGNLRWLARTLGSSSPRELLEATVKRVEDHPHISLFKKARVVHSIGSVGHFLTTIEKEDGLGEICKHGVAVLASGGEEAKTKSYCFGESESIVTQLQLEEGLDKGSIDPRELKVVVMIQCVDSREEPRNYCSRVCCGSALKNSLYLKKINEDITVYIFYRDMMTYGFRETQFTEAREAGVLFIQYDLQQKPVVTVADGRPSVRAREPVLDRQIVIHPDLLVLGTGISPGNNEELARIFGVDLDEDGFFQEAESKWRPVDFLKEGIFTCGISLGPRDIAESIASAEAAAQRALRILGRDCLLAGTVVAEVHHSLCALCERCIQACPYGARWRDEEEEKVVVDELMCQGCGSCATVCPNSASVVRGYRDQQVFSMIDAALDEIF